MCKYHIYGYRSSNMTRVKINILHYVSVLSDWNEYAIQIRGYRVTIHTRIVVKY